MNRNLLSVLLVLAFAGATLAATFNITTTAAQDVKLARYRVILNASGANFADVNAMVVSICTRTIVDGIRDVDDGDAERLATRARSATQTQRDNACTALGGTVVAGRCN